MDVAKEEGNGLLNKYMVSRKLGGNKARRR